MFVATDGGAFSVKTYHCLHFIIDRSAVRSTLSCASQKTMAPVFTSLTALFVCCIVSNHVDATSDIRQDFYYKLRSMLQTTPFPEVNPKIFVQFVFNFSLLKSKPSIKLYITKFSADLIL